LSQEIVIGDIKTAIKNRIAEKYPDAKYYIDGEIKAYPAFYIRTTNIELNNLGLRKRQSYSLTFYMRVEYREGSETASITELNSKLDNVGIVLLDQLRYIELYGIPMYCVGVSNETIDNVRIYDFYITINATYEQLEEIKMQYLEQTQKIKRRVNNFGWYF
jgi:hypothetical protein